MVITVVYDNNTTSEIDNFDEITDCVFVELFKQNVTNKNSSSLILIFWFSK